MAVDDSKIDKNTLEKQYIELNYYIKQANEYKNMDDVMFRKINEKKAFDVLRKMVEGRDE